MEKIINTLSKKLDIKQDLIEKVIKTQFDFVINTIREGEESIHLHYLGKFCIKPGTIERLRLLNERRRNPRDRG